MTNTINTHSRIWLAGAACLILLAATACSSGGSSNPLPTGPVGSFTASGTTGAADLVHLGGSAAGDIVTISAMIDGPTTSSDLHSFAFDLVLGDATVAEYVSGSAIFGTALNLSGGQTSQVLAVQSGSRVTVGVTKLGGGSGNGVTAPGSVVVTFQFRLLKTGSTTLAFEGSPPFDPSAIDSTGSDIPSVDFDLAPALLTAS